VERAHKAVAITVDVVFGGPNETVVDQPEVKEILSDEKEESFWQQNMSITFVCAIGVIIVIVALLLAKHFNFTCPTTSGTSITGLTGNAKSEIFKTLREQIDELRLLRGKGGFISYKRISLSTKRLYDETVEVPVKWPNNVGGLSIEGKLKECNTYRLRDSDKGDYGLVLATNFPDSTLFIFDPGFVSDFWYVDVSTDEKNINSPADLDALKALSEFFKVRLNSQKPPLARV
jgi:hypothetical protein